MVLEAANPRLVAATVMFIMAVASRTAILSSGSADMTMAV